MLSEAAAERRRLAKNAAKRKRRAEDSEFRAKQNTAVRKRRAEDSEFREKQNTAVRKRYAEDPEFRAKRKAAQRKRRLSTKYGLTVEEHAQMLSVQGGACLICRRSPRGRQKALCVDHCHSTGKVRGLLCSSCNSALGLLKEDVDRMQSMIRYVRDFNESEDG
jgi:hypothetical protein